MQMGWKKKLPSILEDFAILKLLENSQEENIVVNI